MATHGGLEIHMEMGHDPEPVASHDARVAPVAAVAPTAAADLLPEVIPGVGLERPRRTARTRTGTGLSAVPLIAFAIVALLVAGVATAVTRRNGPSALAMVH